MRKTFILIERDGERQLVKSLDGCEGWKVVKSRVPEQPTPHCYLCPKGKWVDDPEAAEQARIKRLLREGRLGEALDLLQAREDRAS